jgi:gluconolactonase
MFPYLSYAAVMRLVRGANHRWTMERMTYDTVHPRALALSPDGKTLYLAEGGTTPDSVRELRAYPVNADGTLGRYALLMAFGADQRGVHRGIEGLCVDSAGCLIACGGSKAAGPGPMLYVFSPRGTLMEAHELPDDMPMRCAFGGPARNVLYVTTGAGRLWSARGTGRAAI